MKKEPVEQPTTGGSTAEFGTAEHSLTVPVVPPTALAGESGGPADRARLEDSTSSTASAEEDDAPECDPARDENCKRNFRGGEPHWVGGVPGVRHFRGQDDETYVEPGLLPDLPAWQWWVVGGYVGTDLPSVAVVGGRTVCVREFNGGTGGSCSSRAEVDSCGGRGCPKIMI